MEMREPYIGMVVTLKDGRKHTVTAEDVERWYKMGEARLRYLRDCLLESREPAVHEIGRAVGSCVQEGCVSGLKRRIQDNILDGYNDGRISRDVAEGVLAKETK